MLYEKQNYSTAVEMLSKLYRKTKKTEEKAKYAELLADSYGQMNLYEESAKYYKLCKQYFPGKPSYTYNYATMLMANDDYAGAITELQNYTSEVPGDRVAAENLKMCQLAIDLRNKGTQFSVEPLYELNTKYNEYAPVMRPNGLYFTSDRPGAQGDEKNAWLGTDYSDIFISRKSDDEFETPRSMGEPVNTDANEGVCTFNDQGNVMAYTSCKGEGFDSSCVIIVVRRNRGVWGKPQVLPFSERKGFVFGHPALSPNGNTLVFSSNLGGGAGGHDLWISEFENGNWSTPTNLGPKINTAKDEMFPSFTNENTLYFSSNGHPGFGNLDLFKAIRIKGRWRKPDNLLPPMNSGGDDFGITFNEDGSTGYYATSRAGTKGDDMYSFTMVTPPLCMISGTVYDKKTKKVLANSIVYLTDLVSQKNHAIKTDGKGYYQAYLCYDRDYKMDAYQKFYVNNEEKPRLTTRGLKFEKKFTQDFKLEKWTIDEIRLEGILYDLAKADIRPDAAVILDSLANILQMHQYLVIELSSHTDCRGAVDYNQDLSQKRAESCVNYLVANGIAKDRLVAKGYGENKLLNDCACEAEGDPGYECSDDQHQQNRRTSFSILRTDHKEDENVQIGEIYIEPDCN